ncbi:MAG TPA: bifunctional adenosylcobinamide kinase/adenosylcobinamide-phosphate guanylyltransferase [Rhodoferax sp.]|nr:bifunctional adenosylcobinamide kinase/adenosylcobinamide-phosphate guanylyltransferase [Rhodoferax sp.]
MMRQSIARSELILGGQKSGKSRRAEALAQAWLVQSGQNQAVLIATALACDDEMRLRIARHQADRLLRVPGMTTVEEPWQLAQAIRAHSRPDTLIVVDCLTLWLTNWLMPFDAASAPRQPPDHQTSLNDESNQPSAPVHTAQIAMLLKAIGRVSGPLVLVGNEIGLGVIPIGREVRCFVDALGNLNQDVARTCQRVTLMAAGLPLTLKDVA